MAGPCAVSVPCAGWRTPPALDSRRQPAREQIQGVGVAADQHAALVLAHALQDDLGGLVGIGDKQFFEVGAGLLFAVDQEPGHVRVDPAAAADVGADPTGMHAGGRDAAALQIQFLAQGLGKAAHRELGGVVAAHAGLGEQAEHAGGVDHMPLAAGLEVGQKGLGAVHHAPEINADDPLQVGVVHTFHGARQGHPGIVENQIHLAVFCRATGGPILHGLAVGNIHLP